MTDFVNVYDLNRKKVAILQNAFTIKEEQQLNNIYTLSFNLPDTDAKLQYCQPFYYFRYGDSRQLYRRIRKPVRTGAVGVETISCEHVIATLCDNVLFGAHTYGGTGTHTRDAINYILSKQSTQNWVLQDCDFDYAYEYNWEQENLLNALYSIPEVFTDPYMWVFDTSVYPWRVSLKRLVNTERPDFYIRAKRNLVFRQSEADYSNVCTRLYPLGYGEGINQLKITDVNDGVPYLEAPASVIARYGIKEKVLVDRRFEDAETLKAYGQSVLDALLQPSMMRKYNVIDLYPITSQEIDNAEVGKICKLTEDDTTAYITKTTRILDEPGSLQLDLSTKASDVASAIADLADRVRIESVYAQGATQLYQHSKDANATPEKGMIISLYFPSEMRQINKVLMRLKLNKFRSYSATTDTVPAKVETTSSGGEKLGTTGSGGSIQEVRTTGMSSKRTADAASPGTLYTSAVNGNGEHYHALWGESIMHSHNMEHTHNFDIAISSHTHTVTIPKHTHTVEIEAHSHKIEAGIFESGKPTAFDIFIKGEKKATVPESSYDDDITMWLLDGTGMVPRNQWIDMEIRPNDNAYVVASIFIQGFVQSRGGGNY